jgi:branched-chain amino acid transport system substrate-binding protein
MLLRILSSFFLTIFVLAPSIRAEQNSELKIGLILPLSGAAASYGLAVRNGFEMSVRESRLEAIKLFYEDDQYSAAKAVAAFQKLVNVDKVDIVIGIGSTPSNAVAALAQKAQIPFLAWANDPKVGLNRNFVILTDATATEQGKVLALEAKKRSYSNFALINAVGDYQMAVVDGFKIEIGKAAIRVEEEVPHDGSDFRATLSKIKVMGIESILLCMHPGQSGLFAKQAKQIGLKPNYLGCDAMQDSNENKIAEGALSQALFVASNVSPAFSEKYKQSFGSDAVVTAAANGHEIGRVISMAWAKNRKNKALLDNILATEIDSGPLGKFKVKQEHGLQFFGIAPSLSTYTN